MDPNALLAMARKWRRGDSSVHANNNLQRALQRIRAITYMIAFEKDMFVPPADMALEQQYIGNSEMKVIPSLMGHFAMLELLEEDFNVINDLFAELLSINIWSDISHYG